MNQKNIMIISGMHDRNKNSATNTFFETGWSELVEALYVKVSFKYNYMGL